MAGSLQGWTARRLRTRQELRARRKLGAPLAVLDGGRVLRLIGVEHMASNSVQVEVRIRYALKDGELIVATHVPAAGGPVSDDLRAVMWIVLDSMFAKPDPFGPRVTEPLRAWLASPVREMQSLRCDGDLVEAEALRRDGKAALACEVGGVQIVVAGEEKSVADARIALRR